MKKYDFKLITFYSSLVTLLSVVFAVNLQWLLLHYMMQKAGLLPTPNHIEIFNQHLEDYDSLGKEMHLHQTLRKFSEMATLKGLFFLCRQKSMEIVSLWLKDVDMSPAEKFALCMSPVNKNCSKSKNVLLRYVEVSEWVHLFVYSVHMHQICDTNIVLRSFHHMSDILLTITWI